MRRFTGVALALCVAACVPQAPAAEPVLVAAGGSHRPTIAVDTARDRTYIAWVSGDSVQDVLLAAGRVDGGFAAPVRVNDLPGDAAAHEQAPAQVAVAADGAVYVVWQNNTPVPGWRFPASELRFARSTDGGRTFSAAINPSDDEAGEPTSHTFHNIAVARDGTIYVSWIDGRAGSSDIRVARSTDEGGSFEPSVVVARDACPCCRTSLAVQGDVVHIGWREVTDASVRDIVVARSQDGGRTWSSPERVHADDWVIDGCPHAGPSLAATDDGRLHVAWYTGAEGSQGLHYTVATDGGFSTPRPLNTGSRVAPAIAALAADDHGVVAAWEERTAQGPIVRVTDPTRNEPLLETSGRAPAIARSIGGAVVAWLRNDSVFAATMPR